MTYINRFIALSCVAASVFATSCVNERILYLFDG